MVKLSNREEDFSRSIKSLVLRKKKRKMRQSREKERGTLLIGGFRTHVRVLVDRDGVKEEMEMRQTPGFPGNCSTCEGKEWENLFLRQ